MHKIIGPFPGTTKPVREGLYKRITRKGNEVWSWWSGSFWGLFGSNKQRAIQRGYKRSKHQKLQWMGRVK